MKQYIINKSDILIFDLDDTIYKEINFVNEGFKSVASHLEKITNQKKKVILSDLKKLLLEKGRGKIFDIYCKRKKIYSKQIIKKLIKIYRFHKKKIRVPKSNLRTLKKLRKNFRLYIVTDGMWKVQSHKVKLLKIEKIFSKIFLTDFYGKDAWKPSLKCFRKIKKIENCKWENISYFGDNEKKDFINLNKIGAKTILVKKWSNNKQKVLKSYTAKYEIKSLNNLKF